MQTNVSQDGDSVTLTSQTTVVSEPSPSSLTTEAWNGTQTDVPGGTDGRGGLSEEAKWLLVAAGIVVGLLLLAIAVCVAARWYFHGGNRRRRAKEKEEASLRRREMNDDDLEKGHVSRRRGSPGLPLGDRDTDEELSTHNETEIDLSHHEGSGGVLSARSASSSPKRGAQQRVSEGNKVLSAVLWEDGPWANKKSSPSTNHKDPSVVFVEVSDPVDVLAPMDPYLFKSLYEGDEEGSPLPDKREASWMETAEERQRQKEKQQRAGRKSASQHKFERYLRANREKLRAQQQVLSSPDSALHGGSMTRLKNIVTDVRHHKNLQSLSSADSDESSESSSDESNNNTTLPTNRAEAERMRIDDLNAKVIERRRIEEYFKAAHPVYRFQDPSRVASKALLSTTFYRGRAVLDDSYAKERQEDLEKLHGLVGNDVPWGNRASSVGPLQHTDDSGRPSPVARLQDLPWMTSERVRAVAKEHRRNDRLQLKKQSSIAPYVTEDGRIDYSLAESTTNGGGGREGVEGGGARLTISDRASSFRDRASSVALGGAATRRRRGASEAGGSSIRMNSRASAIVRGTFLYGGAHAGETSSHLSLGRSFANVAHLHIDDEGDPSRDGFNLRNSALTADALREAQEAFGDSSRATAANSSRAVSSRGDYLYVSKGSAVNANSGGYGAARRRKLVRTAGTDRHTHMNETRSEASGFLGGSRSFASGASDHQLGEGQRVDNLSTLSTQQGQGSVGRGVDINYGLPLSDDDDDGLLAVHGVDSLRSPAELTKQALVDARSLSLLRAQLTELRAGDGGALHQSAFQQNSNGISATAAGAYHSMNEAVHRGLSQKSERDTIEQSERYTDTYVRPYPWQREGDEHFFHLSPQPQIRIRRAAEVADAHFVEGLESVAARLDEAEASYYAAREERRQRLVAKRRMSGIQVAEDDSLSDLSEYSAVDGVSLSSDGAVGDVHVRRAAPVSVRENAKGVTVFRAFASPHNDPYLNML